MASGRLITIEGVDGAGKSTLARGLAAELARRGVRVEALREPGGVPLAERIRGLLQHDEGTEPPAPRAEALLYAAARAQLAESRLRPLLAQGTWVLLDRYVDSSLAYQGAARGLGIDAVEEINRFATDGLLPDRTLLLVLAPDAARARQRDRGERPDRLEREAHAFFDAVATAYRHLAAREPERIRELDAAHEPHVVLAEALDALGDLLASI